MLDRDQSTGYHSYYYLHPPDRCAVRTEFGESVTTNYQCHDFLGSIITPLPLRPSLNVAGAGGMVWSVIQTSGDYSRHTNTRGGVLC